MTHLFHRSLRLTPGFTCKARLNDRSRSDRTSAPCLVQALVVQLGDLGDRPAFEGAHDPHSCPAIRAKRT